MTILIVIALIGLVSAAAYLTQRKWVDALLVVAAAGALAGLVGEFRVSAGRDAAVTKIDGDGLRSAQLQDLPARRLEWKAPGDAVLRLDFPRIATPGRMFRLTATMPTPAARRLQLLAENGQMIAEASGDSASLTVQWMPPVAETLVLSARLLDAKGKKIAEGPVPFQVRETLPLQVQGRFASPSFDARALNTLLADSNAVLDWQVVLGKTVTRSETARTEIARPDLLVQDAAHIEKMPAASRAALLAQVAGGTPLLVLASTASEPAFWARTFQLDLKEQSETKASGLPLALMPAPFNPAAKLAGVWSAAGDRVWSRSWEKGRIVWIGVAEWHRHAITEPQLLGVWWQDLLDRAGVRRSEDIAWLEPEDLPLPGHRLEVCALGVKGEVTFPQLKQTLAWQRRPDKADASCVAVWPTAPGWLTMQSGGRTGQLYVHAEKDWPMWQKAQRRDATAQYAARTPAPVGETTKPLLAWPFALLFAAAMLLLWWRERR